MTAVPTAHTTGVHLICDACGDVAITDGCGLHDADVVYVALGAVGWSGSAFARGPHRCPGCSAEVSAVRHTGKAALARVRGSRRATTTRLDRVAVSHKWGVLVVEVKGDIDCDVAAELQTTLDSAVATDPNVVLDLTHAGVIDSAGLGVLVRARNAARHRAGEFVLAAPSRFVLTVLRTMRLHTAFRTFATVRQATTAVRDHGREG